MGCDVKPYYYQFIHFSRHCSKHWVVTADAWAILIIVRFGVAHLIELGL